MTNGSKASFWTTLPGVLTGVAAILTALTGLYLAFADHDKSPGSDDAEEPAVTEPSNPELPANFVRQGSFPLEPPSEYVLGPQNLGLEDADHFLTLTDASFGTATAEETAPNTFRFELTLTNSSANPIHLDLTSRFFALEDDQGRRAKLLHFYCAAHGELLAPHQSRRILLFFHSDGWYGKSLSAHRILLEVTGLLPVERATWELPTLATAD